MNNKYCIGCGILLQCEDSFEDGYVNPNMFGETIMCRRCFRLKNYGEYKVTNKTNSFYKNIIKDIFKANDLVLHIVDIFDIGNIEYIYKNVFSPTILVISKCDIFPDSINESKLIKYFKEKYPKYINIIAISSDKNYHMDEIYESIMKYKNSNQVYVLGNTNAGKSSFINKIIKNYTEGSNYIVTSYMPATTLNVISIKVNDELTLLDTPGIVNDGNITNYVTEDIIKKINIKHVINPRIYQIEDKASLLFEDIGRIDVLDKSNISIYISNNVNIDKINFNTNERYRDLEPTKMRIEKDEEIVIEGLCFIRCFDRTKFEMYIPKDIDIYRRKSILS